MRLALNLLTLSACATLPFISYAATAQLPCANSKTTMALNACVAKQYQHTKQQLHVTYRAALIKAKEIDRIQHATGFQTPQQNLNAQALVASQTAWKQYQTAYCTSVRYYFGYGTYHTVAYWQCMQATAKARITALNNEYIHPAIAQQKSS